MAKGIVERRIECISGSAQQSLMKIQLEDIERVEVCTARGKEHEGHTIFYLHSGKRKYSRESLKEINKAIAEASK